MAALDALIDQINHIDPVYEYWFVRTDSGLYFDTYYQNDFIAIGWNYITLDDLTNKSAEEIKAKIQANEPKFTAKGAITRIYTKLRRFVDLRSGDRVMIPSELSERFAFGVVADERPYVNIDQAFGCEYYKRRVVKWFLKEEMRNLDPTFYRIRKTMHAISSIKEDSAYIDKVMDSLFVKSGRSHFVINVDRRENINLKSLTVLVSGLEDIMQKINVHFNLNEDISQAVIKLNLQSKGAIEIIESGRTLIILAALLSSLTLTGDSQLPLSEAERAEFNNFKQVIQSELDSVDVAMEQLEVNRQKINSGVVDGHN